LVRNDEKSKKTLKKHTTANLDGFFPGGDELLGNADL